MAAHSGRSPYAPSEFPPPVDTVGEFVKRGTRRRGRADRGRGGDRRRRDRGTRMRQPAAAAARGRPRSDGEARRSPGGGRREGQDLRWAQPLGRGDAPGSAPRAVRRSVAGGLAHGALRVRRGHQGVGVPAHRTEDQGSGADLRGAELQEPRQRGGVGVGPGSVPAAPRRGGRSVRAHRDLGHAADRAGRPGGRRPLGRQGPGQGRRAAGQLRAGHRYQGPGDGPRRGLVGPPHRCGDQGVRPRRATRAPGLGARRQGGVEGQAAA